MLFSHVKISSFHAKAHLVFHGCLYNKVIYAMKHYPFFEQMGPRVHLLLSLTSAHLDHDKLLSPVFLPLNCRARFSEIGLKSVMPTLLLLARDLCFFASSPALALWYINLPLFTSTINIEYLVKNKTDLL